MPGPPELSPEELATLSDPAELLERARDLEPALRLGERAAALDRLEQLLTSEPPATPPPPGRDWRLEAMAERAIDATSHVELTAAEALVDQILSEADPSLQLTIVRALSARARVRAWTGTEQGVREADGIYQDAMARCRALGHRDWLGVLTYWRATTVFFQNGDPQSAVEQLAEALEVLGEDSPRRSGVLTFYAEVLISIGEWDRAAEVLAEARAVADRDGDAKSRGYVAWCGAQMASMRGDALSTERLLRETERDGGDWLAMDTGVTFRAEAAEMLDRVGLDGPAQHYLQRATEQGEDDDQRVAQARATLLARGGDPWQGLEALQELTRLEQIERRLLWRHMLLGAWATFRAGGDAGPLAAQALDRAERSGGIRVAQAAESDLVTALAPLAALTGSAPARALLLAGRRYLVWLFGTPTVMRADGSAVTLPRGRAAALVRMLALHEHGLPVDVVLETFFPEVSAANGRHRLRQVLLRLRSVAPDLVLRAEDHLTLAPAWVDVRAFLRAADRMRGAPGSRGVRLAYTALATVSGPLLATDPYADWAQEIRGQVEYRQLTILDRIVADAMARGSLQEALTAVEAVLSQGGVAPAHLQTLREHLIADGRLGTVAYLEARG